MQNIVLCPGMPRSGTTSLSRLIASNCYKEPQYLFGLYNFESCYPKLYPKEIVETHINYIFYRNKMELNLEPPYSFEDYSKYISEIFNKFNNIFDDVICLSTEKFFGNQQEFDKLTNFLEIDRIEMSNEKSNEINYNKFSQDEMSKYQLLLKSSCDFYANL